MSSLSPITSALFASAYTPPQQDLFSTIDTNGDGQITPDELTSFGQNLPGAKGKGLANPNLFQKIDTNGDGAISKDEWAAHRQARASRAALLKVQEQSGATGHHPHGASGPRQVTPGATFSALDTNKDGIVSPEEWAAAYGNTAGTTTSSDVKAVGQTNTSLTGTLTSTLNKTTDTVETTVSNLWEFAKSL